MMGMKTAISEIDWTDICYLVDLMRECDDTLEELFDAIRWITLLPEEFAPIKVAAVFWGRISELLGFTTNSCMNDLPIIYLDDFCDSDGYECGVCDRIADFILNSCDFAKADMGLLNKAGITVSNTSLTPDDIKECLKVAEDTALFMGEIIDNDKIREKAYNYLKVQTFPIFSDAFPDFAELLIDTVRMKRFCASEIVCFRSKRVGRFLSNKERLRTILRAEMMDAVMFLIRVVFDPLYVYYPYTSHTWMNEAGEYCSVFCLGSYEDSVEDDLYGIHKRPYADIAVALLDRLLTEADSLAPDILCDVKVPAEAE